MQLKKFRKQFDSSTIPFLLYKLIHYTVYSEISRGGNVTQDQTAKACGFVKKPFSQWGMSPVSDFNKYGHMFNYIAPQIGVSYNGKKANELGRLITILSAQAGNYEYLPDAFGGSGAAFMNFPPKSKVQENLNDKDPFIYNFYTVMQDNVLFNQFQQLYKDLVVVCKQDTKLLSDIYTYFYNIRCCFGTNKPKAITSLKHQLNLSIDYAYNVISAFAFYYLQFFYYQRKNEKVFNGTDNDISIYLKV